MLTVIVWIILIYFAIWLLWRLFVPWLLKRFFRNLERRFNAHGGETQQNKKYGEVSIEDSSQTSQRPESEVDESEYVDFEEIKNDNSDPQ